MQKDIISSIFKKGKVTGDDVGRLLLADMAEEMISLAETGKVKATFTQAEFDSIRNKLTDNYQIERYNLYTHIYNAIKGMYSFTNMIEQSALGDINKYKDMITGIQGSIARTIIEDKKPLVMTQKQYDKAFKEVFEAECEEKYNYIWLFLCAVQYYFTNYEYYQREGNEYNEKTPKKDKKADAIIKQYKEEPVSNKALLEVFKDRYEADNYIVHYYFKDTGEQIPADNTELIKELNKRGIPNTFDKFNLEDEASEIPRLIAGIYTYDETYNNIERFTTDEVRDKYFDKKVTYKQHEQPITKFDIADLFFMFDDYDLLGDEDAEADKVIVQRFNLILQELPELKEFITEKLEAYKDLAQYMPKKTCDIVKLNIPYKVLYDNDICNFKSYVINSFRNKYYKARNGVAIVNEAFIEEWEREDYITPEGEYKTPKTMFSVADAVADITMEKLAEKEDIHPEMGIQEQFYSGVRFLYAYNKFIEIIADVVKVPKLDIWQVSPLEIENNARRFNEVLHFLISCQIDTYAQNGRYDEAQKLKETILKTLPYIDLEKVKVKEENYKKGLEYISDIKNFTNSSPDPLPIYILAGITPH